MQEHWCQINIKESTGQIKEGRGYLLLLIVELLSPPPWKNPLNLPLSHKFLWYEFFWITKHFMLFPNKQTNKCINKLWQKPKQKPKQKQNMHNWDGDVSIKFWPWYIFCNDHSTTEVLRLLIPTESTSAFHSTNLFLFSCHHIPTNGVAPLCAYKPTYSPQFLQSLWRRANAQNVSFFTLYGG